MPPFIIRLVSWRDEAHLLRTVREVVFIEEQQIPAELEWDEFDINSLHALALAADGRPIGTARLLSDGHIGRMAVLQEWRGQGVGSALLRRLLEEMKNRKFQHVVINAQIDAIRFYKKFEFKIAGKRFIEAGIPHVQMILRLQD